MLSIIVYYTYYSFYFTCTYIIYIQFITTLLKPIPTTILYIQTESLVFVPLMTGLLFFLTEFFLDQMLAFLVLTLIWAAEVYSIIR